MNYHDIYYLSSFNEFYTSVIITNRRLLYSTTTKSGDVEKTVEKIVEKIEEKKDEKKSGDVEKIEEKKDEKCWRKAN
ncbi:hypothetical protein Pyn_12599 [Prunus yedoensis var. nudiflora]|uniref:Uncharacterized protein n=1 Tax=Prunus yedoensis var. nudiflora TaxID=2094558 RepID=A0A314YB08_PRUYE|nr:hypothetical protein Pyn_12599 [Prunus yedoensis var. nudiflora]